MRKTVPLLLLGALLGFTLALPQLAEGVHFFSTKAMQAMEKLVNSNGQIGAETDSSGGLVVTNYLEQPEITAPSAPATDRLRLYAKDDGLGNTHLYARDSIGAETDLFVGGGGGGGASSLNDLTDVTITPPGYTSGLVLRANGVEFVNAQLGFADLTGSATAAQGGTGFSSYTVGDMLYASSATVLSKLGIGANGKFLTVASGLPAWGDAVDLTTNQTIGGVKTFTSIPVGPATNPTTDNQLARKAYVDSIAAGLSVRESCKAATTAALPANTRTGNILTASANGAFPAIDGVTIVLNDRLLVKNEATQANNGIYTLTQVGDVSNPWQLTRATDYDTSAEVDDGTFTSIINGTTNGNTQWVQVTKDPVLNTDALVFSQLSKPDTYTASLGVKKVGFDFQADISATGAITLTGNSLQAAADDSTIERFSNALRVKDLGITNAKLAGGITDDKLNTITTANKVNWGAVNKAGSAISDIADTNFTSLGAGALIYRNSGNTSWVNLPAGTEGQVLKVSSGIPVWGAGGGGGGGTATSADFIPRPNKRKFFLTTATATTYTSVGVSSITNTGTQTNSNDSKTTWTNHRASASAGSSGSVRSTAFTLVRRAHDPLFIAHVRTGADITNLRIWVGLMSTTTSNSDTLNGQGFAFRYSSAVGPNWFAVTRDGTTQTATDTGLAVAASTDYLLRFDVNSAAGTVKFTVNGGNSTTLSTNLPAAATDLGFVVIAYTTTATNKDLAISRIYCEFTGSEITFATQYHHASGSIWSLAGLTPSIRFATFTPSGGITVTRITVTAISLPIGGNDVFRLTDGTTNVDVTLTPTSPNNTVTLATSTNFAASTELRMEYQSSTATTRASGINMLAEYTM
ncbi:MAG: hypothetical protein HYZ89_07220 [Candidatus Omnitrophica bacterium]|nr:hypothetical protein [Candidatus Omnitrophota bacterium]